MDSILEIAGYNFVAALLLGILVWGVTRVWRNPPVAHVLWVIVLVRLISPPLFEIEWSPGFPVSRATKNLEKSLPLQNGDRVMGEAKVLIPGTRMVYEGMDKRGQIPVESSGVVTRWVEGWNLVRSELFFVWILGAGVVLLTAVVRIISFQVRIQGMMPAGEQQQRLVADLATGMGMKWVPRLKINEREGVPMAVCLGGRGTILVSRMMLERLTVQELESVLVHELAHLKRRDHLVRVVELLASATWWWNPLVKFARKELHRAEEASCDAWVTRLYPQRLREYAEVLLQAACREGCFEKPPSALASPFIRSHELKERIEMVMQGNGSQRVSNGIRIWILIMGLVFVGTFLRSADAEGEKSVGDGTPGDSSIAAQEKPESESDESETGETMKPPKAVKNTLGMLLKYGDEKADGKKSLGGSGEVIHFELPEGISEVKGLKIHGSRYGYPQPPNEDFEMTFVSEDFSEILMTEEAPYSLFQRGESKWTNVKFKKTVSDLPRTFWIVLNFHAEQRKGVYVSYDTSTKGVYSRIGLAGENELREVEFKGDWMVQIQTGKK